MDVESVLPPPLAAAGWLPVAGYDVTETDLLDADAAVLSIPVELGEREGREEWLELA